MTPAQISDALASRLQPRVVLEQPIQPAELAEGSLDQFLRLLAELGISSAAFLESLRPLDLTEVGAAFEYLKYAVLTRDATAAQLQFHLELLASLPSNTYPDWTRMAQELSQDGPFTPDVHRFVETVKIPELLYNGILLKLGLTNAGKFRPLGSEKQFILFALLFLESFADIAGSDPAIAVLFEAVNRYGSLPEYFRNYDPARQVVYKLSNAGFNTDYLLDEGSEVYSRTVESVKTPDEWAQRLDRLVLQLLGDQARLPELDLGVDRFKFINQIKEDLDDARSGNKNAAAKVIEQLLPKVELREQQFRRAGNLAAASKAREFIRSLRSISDRIRPAETNDKELRARYEAAAKEPFRLSVRRSGKEIPALFFDDDRFGSWMFKPGGLFHGEISRLLLDPATPLTEFWLYPHFVFMGLAALFPGYNTRRQRTILVDEFNYDEQLLEALGLEGTLEFVLDALVIDAQRAGAVNLAVFAAASGRAGDLPEYIERVAGQLRSITYYESYPFESVDPASSGLSQCPTGAFHTTESLGYANPLSGIIDFPFNQITYVSVEKNTTGRHGVFEIDIRTYLSERKLMNKISESQPRTGNQETPRQRTPSGRTSETDQRAQREQRAIDAVVAVMRSAVPDILIERHVQLDERLLSDLVSLHAAAFPDYPRYSGPEYLQRIAQPNAETFVLRTGDRVIGLALWHTTPLLPDNSVYIDELAIDPGFQNRHLGSELLRLLARIAGIRAHRQLYLLTRMDAPAARLLRLYEREGFRFIGQYEGLGNLLMRPLSLTGAENARTILAMLNRLEKGLSDRLDEPRATLHAALDPDLLKVMQDLESIFPEDMRYSEAELIQRFSFPDAFVLVLREGGKPVAFALCYQDPLTPPDVIFGDSMALEPQYQKRGIGTDFIKTVLAIPTVTFYTGMLFFCREWNHDGVNLPQYYGRFGAKVLDRTGDRVRMLIPLGADEPTGNVNASPGSTATTGLLEARSLSSNSPPASV